MALLPVVIKLVACVSLCLGSCTSLEECYAEEGEPYSLSCNGRVTDRFRQVWWTTGRLDDRKADLLSTCYLGTEQCVNRYPEKFTSTIHFQEDEFTSNVTIHHVTRDTRMRIFNCSKDAFEPRVQRSCLMSVYHLPVSLACTARQIDDDGILVSCRADKVYPGIACQISREFYYNPSDCGAPNNYKLSNVAAEIAYTKEPIAVVGQEYYSATCSAKIYYNSAGSQRFRVHVYPEGSDRSLVSQVVQLTNCVSFVPSGVHTSSTHEEDVDGMLERGENKIARYSALTHNSKDKEKNSTNQNNAGSGYDVDNRNVKNEEETFIDRNTVVAGVIILEGTLVCIFCGILVLIYMARISLRRSFQVKDATDCEKVNLCKPSAATYITDISWPENVTRALRDNENTKDFDSGLSGHSVSSREQTASTGGSRRGSVFSPGDVGAAIDSGDIIRFHPI